MATWLAGWWGPGRGLRAGGAAEVRRPGACRTRELHLSSYPLFQVHLTKEPPDRREHDGVELTQLGSRLESEQILEPSPCLLESFESRLHRAGVLGAQLRRRTGVVADELPERVDAGGHLMERLGESEEEVGTASCGVGSWLGGGVHQRAEHRPNRDRAMLQRLEPLAQTRPEIRCAHSSHVQTATQLGVGQGRAGSRHLFVGDSTRLVQPPPCRRCDVTTLLDQLRELRSGVVDQFAHGVSQPIDGLGRGGGGDLGREEQVRREPDRGPHQGLHDPLPRRRPRPQRSHPEHEHRADRYLDEVVA